MTNIPQNFDGGKFARKYNLDVTDFRVLATGEILCPSLPNLTASDLLDCVADYPIRLTPSQQMILADGEDVARVTINGTPDATVDYTVNGEPFQTTLDASGQDVIELDCDTPGTTLLVQSGTARAVIYAMEVPS